MPQSKPWAVRVAYDGVPVGAGILVAKRWVLTCAHVVDQRSEKITVKFTGRPHELSVATFLPNTWPNDDGFGDIAALYIDGDAPEDVTPCRFAVGDEVLRDIGLKEIALRAKGYPKGVSLGVHATVKTSQDRDIEGEWLEISISDAHLQPLDHGFSGAAVYVPSNEHVVGMVCSTKLASGGRGGFEGRMLPAESIRKYWGELEGVPCFEWRPTPPRTPGSISGVRGRVRPVGGYPRPAASPARGSTILDQYQVELLDLVKQLPRPALWQIYRKVAGPTGRPLGAESTRLAGLVNLVAGLPYSDDDVPPLLRMAEWQALMTDESEIRQKLHAWVDRVSQGTGIRREAVLAMRKEVIRDAAEQSQPSYLMVHLEPSRRPAKKAQRRDGPRFDLGLWLWSENGGLIHRVDTEGLVDLSLGRLEKLFRENLLDWVKSVDETTLAVEFFVPREQLGCAFDQWVIEALNGDDTHLGLEFVVTVRDAARLEERRRRTHGEWRRRWTRLGSGGDVKIVAHSEPKDLLRYSLKESEQYVCLAIRTSAASDESTVNALAGEAFDAGLPVAVWVRGCASDPTVPSLDDIVEAPLPLLPTRIKEIRREMGGIGHPGKHLTLVWDDPDRLVDMYPLAST